MRHLILVALLITICPLRAEEPAPEPALSSRAAYLVESYRKSAAEAQDDYRRALQRIKDRAVAELDREKKNITRRGDLEGALAIQSAIDQVLADDGGLVPLDILGNEIQVPEQPDSAKISAAMVGRWVCKTPSNTLTYTWNFSEDGKISGTHDFLWRLDETHLIIYSESRPMIMHFPLPIRESGWPGTHLNGQQHVMTKVK